MRNKAAKANIRSACCALTLLVLWTAVCHAAGTSRIVVKNNCPIALWVHFTEMPVVAKPSNGVAIKMDPGESRLFDTLATFGGGRCWAYYKDPGKVSSFVAPLSSYNGFCEMTVEPHVMNYNVSFVDYAALPVSLVGVKQDGSTCQPTQVCWNFTEWKAKLQGCPTELEDYMDDIGIGRCLSAFFYCVKGDNETSKEFCYKMHLAHPAYSAAQIYGGNFPNVGGWLIYDSAAAWNRGTFAGDADSSNYYKGPEKVGDTWVNPYNTYAKWVHRDLAAEVYAFANDDHQNHSGFVRCINCDELDITWCPCEHESVRQAFAPVVRLQNSGFIAYRVITANGRIVTSGNAASLQEVGAAVAAHAQTGIYFVVLYDRAGRMVAQKRIVTAR